MSSAAFAARFAEAEYAKTLRSATATAACGAAKAAAPGARVPPGVPTACACHSLMSESARREPTASEEWSRDSPSP